MTQIKIHKQIKKKYPELSYIEKCVGSKEGVFLLEKKVFPDLKEITEAYSLLEAISLIQPRSKEANILVVGDGVSPRLGALLVKSSTWNVTTIDPSMKEHWQQKLDIDRLKVHRCKLEDLKCEPQDIIVLPHSHADLSECIDSYINLGLKCVVSMPCCFKDTPKLDPYLVRSYVDTKCLSDKNTINIYDMNCDGDICNKFKEKIDLSSNLYQKSKDTNTRKKIYTCVVKMIDEINQ